MKNKLIFMALKFLVKKENLDTIQELVWSLFNDTELSGKDKKELVLLEMTGKMAGFLVSQAIEYFYNELK